MAHNKVYGICESKCMVEVSEKGKEFVINATRDFITRYKCEKINDNYFVKTNLSEVVLQTFDDYYLYNIHLDDQQSNLLVFVNDTDKRVDFNFINHFKGSNVYVCSSDLSFDKMFLVESDSSENGSVEVGQTIYFGFAQTNYNCNKNENESLITLDFDKPHQKFFKARNDLKIKAPFNCNIYVIFKPYVKSADLLVNEKTYCKSLKLYANEVIDWSTSEGSFFEIDVYINGYHDGEE